MSSIVRFSVRFMLGALFGLGLILAGMINPAKILSFLDLAAIASGQWDPSLLCVMAGAISVTAFGYHFVLKRQRPIAAHHFHLPTRTELDMRLIIGPALFGVGWGIAGFCPGPAFTALGLGSLSTLIFVIPMLLGAYGARTLALHTDAKRKMAHETINNTQ